jgi:hypothetical protein
MKTRFARCKNTSALCATDKYDLRRRQLLPIARLDALQSLRIFLSMPLSRRKGPYIFCDNGVEF